MVYAKPPFGGPDAVLAYLSLYSHRVVISNARLASADAGTMAFRWKDYRTKRGDRQKVIRLATPEFIRRFLMHVLPDGFHRIRHYGLLAGAPRKATICHIRDLLGEVPPEQETRETADLIPLTLRQPCPLLRRTDAHRRNLLPRAETDVPRTASEAGRMTKRAFLSRRPLRSMPVDWTAIDMPGAAIGSLTRDHLLRLRPEIMVATDRSRNRYLLSSRRPDITSQ